MKYIDAEKLTKFEETLADIIVSSQGLCTYEACKDMAKSEAPFLITALQQEQPEEDLEKIINNYFKDWKFDDDLDIMVKPNNYSASSTDLKNIARHFYELGINARKEI